MEIFNELQQIINLPEWHQLQDTTIQLEESWFAAAQALSAKVSCQTRNNFSAAATVPAPGQEKTKPPKETGQIDRVK